MFYKPKRGKYAGKRFVTYTAYRNKLAKDKGYKSYSDQRNTQAKEKGYASYWDERKTKATKEYRERKLQYLANMGIENAPSRRGYRKFDQLYNAVRKDRMATNGHERVDYDGPLAQFLDFIGVRRFDEYGYGDIGVYEDDTI